MEAIKVFCSECEYSDMGECWHKNNLIETPVSRRSLHRSRESINKNNDCSWYKPKFSLLLFLFTHKNKPTGEK